MKIGIAAGVEKIYPMSLSAIFVALVLVSFIAASDSSKSDQLKNLVGPKKEVLHLLSQHVPRDSTVDAKIKKIGNPKCQNDRRSCFCPKRCDTIEIPGVKLTTRCSIESLGNSYFYIATLSEYNDGKVSGSLYNMDNSGEFQLVAKHKVNPRPKQGNNNQVDSNKSD